MTKNLPLQTALALTLAISAIATPVALARFDLNPPTATQIHAAYSGLCSEACSGGGYGTASGRGAPPILPTPKPWQRATINQAQQQEAQRLAYNPPKSAKYSKAEMNAYSTYGSAGVPLSVVRVIAPSGGFDWGDAGIGAASGFALSILGLGGALVVSRRRSHRSSESAALTN